VVVVVVVRSLLGLFVLVDVIASELFTLRGKDNSMPCGFESVEDVVSKGKRLVQPSLGSFLASPIRA
jgi:hypothetical protein